MIESSGIIHDLFHDYTLRTVALGSAILGLVSGSLGSYAVLRKQSLLGDAISHAALPGVAVAFILTGTKTISILMLGAIISGWIGTLLVNGVVRSTRIKEDSALGIVLSVFFGIGLVLLSYIQKSGQSSQSGLDKFLFGQAATMIESDVIVMSVLGLLAIGLMILFWKEFRLLSFDSDFGLSVGYPMRRIEILLTTLIVVAIVIGLQAVGAVLMSAMLVAPAAGARQWTDKLAPMILIAALFGAISGVTGAVISAQVPSLPTGPTIILVVSALVITSLLLAPNRGLIWSHFRTIKNNKRLQMLAVLEDLYVLSTQHEQDHPHDIVVLRAMSEGHGGTDRSLGELEGRGFAKKVDDGWMITEKGITDVEERMNKTKEN